MQIIDFVKHYFKFIFYCLLFCSLIVLNSKSRDRATLVSPLSPKGMVSLKRTQNKATQDSIIRTWEHTVVNNTTRDSSSITARQIAIRQTNEDFLFIACYALLLFSLILFLSEAGRTSWIILMKLLVLAAVA